MHPGYFHLQVRFVDQSSVLIAFGCQTLIQVYFLENIFLWKIVSFFKVESSTICTPHQLFGTFALF